MSIRLRTLSFLSLFIAGLFLNILQQPHAAEAAAQIPLRWMYYVNSRSLESLKANAGNIDVISPDYYRLNVDGTIRGSNRSDVTNYARASGIKVIPMLQNDPTKDAFNKILSDPLKLKNILDTIELQIFSNNYDGYQIDFEDLTEASEPLLTNFMRELYNRLHPKGKLVTMAVVARVSATSHQFGAAYNYSDLAPYVDLVTVMTYDYSWSGGEPGPVAPVLWQEKVMSYAVPRFGANKILLGVPFYGYDWNLTRRAVAPEVKAEGRDYDEVIQLQRETNGIFGYDNIAQVPYLDYEKNSEKHKIYFENAKSLAAKFDMMKRIQVRGFAAWRLGHEGSDFWPIIKNLILPTKRITSPGPDTSYRTYYPQTGHTLQAVFKRYWERYGGLAQFGYPWTEEFEEPSSSEYGKNFVVQYYERNRFEYHPEFAGTKFEVLLGLLGRQVTAGREYEQPFQPLLNPRLLLVVDNTNIEPRSMLRRLLSVNSAPENSNYYPETGHTLRGAFKNYWEKNGGLFIFGYPISEEFQELNPSSGKVYTVQYFERNRFEFHPENTGTKYEVLMGLLGNQVMADKGWL